MLLKNAVMLHKAKTSFMLLDLSLPPASSYPLLFGINGHEPYQLLLSSIIPRYFLWDCFDFSFGI
jgi:hypothetical protein